MKRILLGLSIAALAATAAPQASAEVVYCGITPRIPCGYCHTDVTTGRQTCVPGQIGA